jgi:hypothetical protein
MPKPVVDTDGNPLPKEIIDRLPDNAEYVTIHSKTGTGFNYFVGMVQVFDSTTSKNPPPRPTPIHPQPETTRSSSHKVPYNFTDAFVNRYGFY